ncbi:CRISPR-associated endonuclease Cas2 [Lentihominibacter hominis]|jgi:CRISPR-associated protein Cas2|nr:CRISPR-associated endonuclease Cas2 [Lentihominibacter hominis]
MRLLCMFDLPVETGDEKRSYRIFRKNLIKEGFIMLQYSVYMRTCPNREYAHALEKRLKKYIPANGNIRLVSITEKQYEDMIFLVGSKQATEEAVGTERMVII